MVDLWWNAPAVLSDLIAICHLPPVIQSHLPVKPQTSCPVSLMSGVIVTVRRTKPRRPGAPLQPVTQVVSEHAARRRLFWCAVLGRPCSGVGTAQACSPAGRCRRLAGSRGSPVPAGWRGRVTPTPLRRWWTGGEGPRVRRVLDSDNERQWPGGGFWISVQFQHR